MVHLDHSEACFCFELWDYFKEPISAKIQTQVPNIANLSIYPSSEWELLVSVL